jgi:hypothetical protein
VPFCPTPHSILPVYDSHKYSADLMRGYHCNKVIESKWMLHLGIAHNRKTLSKYAMGLIHAAKQHYRITLS